MRQPLNAVIGFTDVLLQDPDKPATQRAQMLGHVRTAGRHLLALVDRTLDLAKIEAGRLELALERATVASIVNGVTDVLGSLAKDKGGRRATPTLSAPNPQRSPPALLAARLPALSRDRFHV